MSVEEQLKTFIEGTFSVAKNAAIAIDDPLLDSGLIDSTGIFEVIAYIESEFGIQLQDDEVVPENFETIRAIAAFVAKKKPG